MSERYLSHFTFLQYTDAYWSAAQETRENFRAAFLKDLRAAMERFDLYQIFPTRTEADFLLWTNWTVTEPDQPAKIFQCLASVLMAQRAWVRPVQTLWGFTGSSTYARGKSAQAIDPLAETRKTYLVVYPFVKTTAWYHLSRDARQGMMNEHIRIGHQYETITQLLLYSSGLQDQEFVVIYETDELPRFSELVAELRSSDARPYTERDTPLFTAFHQQPEEVLRMAGG